MDEEENTGTGAEETPSNMDRLYSFLTGSGGRNLAGLGLLTNAYNRLGDIGQTGLDLGQQLAAEQVAQSTFRPYTVTTATGGQFGTQVTPFDRTFIDPVTGETKTVTEERVSTTMGLSPEEEAIQRSLLSQASTAFAPPIGTLNLEQAGLGAIRSGQQLMGQPTFGMMPTQEAAQQAFGLGSQFMGAAGMPTMDREQALFERMRTVQRPEEERQRLELEQRLAAQGRLGTSSAAYGGATPEQLAMATAQEEARNRAMLGAMEQARAEQAQQAALGAQYAGLGTTLSGQQRALDAARQQQALQALTAGQGLLGGGLGLEQLQQQIGLGALGGAYVPQAQLLSALAPGQAAAAQAQQAQLYGTGLFGEATASGIEALLGAGLGQANLIGTAGAGLLGGASASGAGSGETGDGILGTGKGFSEFLDDVIGLDPNGGGLFRFFNRGGDD